MTDSSRQKKVIGLVLPYLKSRGTEKQALKLASGFAEKKLNVVLFVVQGWGQEAMYQSFKDAGVNVVNIGGSQFVGVKKVNFFRVFLLAKMAKNYQCDVLLSRAGMTNRITGYAAKIALIPSIIVFSGAAKKSFINNKIKEFFLTVYTLFRLGFPSKIISVSKEEADNFRKNYPLLKNRIFPIQNGVDVSLGDDGSQIKLDKQNFNVCFSGSLEIKRKGVDLLLKALQGLVFDLNQKEVRLVLIGSGDDQEEIKRITRELSLTEYVIFAGELACPLSVIKQCNVFVLPSRVEGFPNALLEAMGSGVCSIAADCDTGPREIINNNQNGLLVPAGDSKVLAAAILRVKEDFQLRNKLAQNAYKTVIDEFSVQKMIDKYYKTIIDLAE